ncbi:MAG: tyrosine-protein phosphatase [Bacteroidota bacterium]
MNKLLILLLPILACFYGCADYEKPARPDRTLVEKVLIERSQNGENLKAISSNEFRLFAMDENGAWGKEIQLGEGGSIPFPAEERPTFWAVQGQDSFRVRERHIPVEGSPNIREVGGLFTQDGYQVKWGKVFRSGATYEIPESEFPFLKTLSLKTICDFRTPAEREDEPDNWPDIDQIKLVFNTVGDTNLMQNDWLAELQKEDFNPEQILIDGNRSFVEEGTPAYTKFFELLLEEANYPLLYHCSAGKDRAGFATVSLLMALGVDSTQAVQDYLMSNYYRYGSDEDRLEKAATFLGAEPEKLRPLMSVKPTYIAAAFEAIRENHGSFEAYLCESLGVCSAEREKLKSMLLYDYQPDTLVQKTDLISEHN